MNKRVLVVGAGALGSVVSATLRQEGHDVVTLVRPGPIAEALERDGFVLHDTRGTHSVAARATTALSSDDRFDVVLLTTQPQDIEAAAEQAAPCLADGASVVVLANGLCEARVAGVVGDDAVIGAVVAWGASVEGPGEVRRTSEGRFTLGRPDGGDDPRLEALAELLAPVAPSRVTDNLLGARWTKLAFNCAISTLGTIGGDRVGPLIAHAVTRRLALEVMTEAVHVAQAEGVRLEKLAGFVSLDRIALAPDESKAALMSKHAVLMGVGARIRHLRSSMLRAIESGREPAVDFLNGEIVRGASRHGLQAPVNAAATELVHRIARGEVPAGLDTLRGLFEATRPR